jgi:ornithine cyclodeaminase/alanine dehydrogenase-like protein (mu-crystallin family)
MSAPGTSRPPAPPDLLDEAAVAELLRMEDLVDLMERTLADFSSGRSVQPVRTVLPVEPHDALLAVMPGYLPKAEALAVKVVTVAPRNVARGLPSHLATVLLLDPETGALLAILDGRLITEMRTAAVSAAAARALARPEAAVLALLGSGVQAQSHLEAFRLVRPLERVRVWSPDRGRREAFARAQAKRWSLEIEAADSPAAAVRGAHLVVTATSSRTPVLEGRWLEPGVHVTGVGACRSDQRELDAETVRRSSVWVDSLAAARIEAGDLLLAGRDGVRWEDQVRGEIGAVFEGTLAGRRDPAEITCFKSLGLAVEDAASARHVWRLARERPSAPTPAH